MLYTAVWRGHIGMAQLLVDAGADVNARNNSGDSMLHEVRFRGHSDIEQILLSADATE